MEENSCKENQKQWYLTLTVVGWYGYISRYVQQICSIQHHTEQR